MEAQDLVVMTRHGRMIGVSVDCGTPEAMTIVQSVLVSVAALCDGVDDLRENHLTAMLPVRALQLVDGELPKSAKVHDYILHAHEMGIPFGGKI